MNTFSAVSHRALLPIWWLPRSPTRQEIGLTEQRNLDEDDVAVYNTNFGDFVQFQGRGEQYLILYPQLERYSEKERYAPLIEGVFRSYGAGSPNIGVTFGQLWHYVHLS